MWQYDAARSAQTPVELSETLHLQWVRELPEPQRAWPLQEDDRGKLDFDVSYTPVVMGDKLFVPSNVTDSVTAYRIEDGVEQWRFYTDGPVRLAPAAWDGRVYFTSDDGHLYCVAAEDGELVWRFRAGPSDHRLLGNERIINFWAARGGPVIIEGNVYFAAGVWPLHGVFTYALDRRSGEVLWRQDNTGHVGGLHKPDTSERYYGDLSPQGYLAAGPDHLVIAPGRGQCPMYLDRHTGAAISVRWTRPRRGGGGYAVHAEGLGWKHNEMIASRVEGVSDQIEGTVFYQLAARDRLFVTTEDGTLYCFGPRKIQPRRHEYRPARLVPESTDWAAPAAEIIKRLDDPRGYALILGVGSGDLLRELLSRSELHIVVVEEDSTKVRALRDELARTGMYGRRAAVIEAAPAAFSVQPYLFRLVAAEDAAAAGIDADAAVLHHLLDRLRPYSGLGWFGASGQYLSRLIQAAKAAGVDQVSVEKNVEYMLATRAGPLSGAGEWTHQYHDAGNTLLSRDQRVRLPLGVLWYGGPTNHHVPPRKGRAPRPQVVGGRQVFVGMETISARCVYTGRELWEREFPGIGKPFDSVSNIPGATYIGSPFVSLPDAVYLRWEGKIYRLDPATGKTTDTFALPGRLVEAIYDDRKLPDWGHVSVRGDYLIVTAEPHLFEDQRLGGEQTYTGTSSRRLAVLQRHSGEVLWEREAEVGFRHNAIVSSNDALYLIDGLSENALKHLARRGRKPESPSKLRALELASGREIWNSGWKVLGTFLLYSEDYDILVEGGNFDVNWGHVTLTKGGSAARREDEPKRARARRGRDGKVLWESEHFLLPAVVRDTMLISASRYDHTAVCLLTGEPSMREEPHTGKTSRWRYSQRKNCDALNASVHLLLFRSGYAGYFDLEHDTGTGMFTGFRAGCSANMIAADGVLSALDYSRTCVCSYPIQTSLALIPMPGDSNIEFWTRYAGSRPDPTNHGLNFGAPGRRVDVAGSGRVWYGELDTDPSHPSQRGHDGLDLQRYGVPGTKYRHPSAIVDSGGSLAWVASSLREFNNQERLVIRDLPEGEYALRLHFAELDDHIGPGQRVFDVLIDGQKMLDGFDIVEDTGGPLRGTVKTFSVPIDGTLSIELRKTEASELNPVISGLEVLGKR